MLLLVPEQFSFEMEKQVYELLSRHGDQQLSLNVEVYSFTRLCHRVFTEWGGMAGEYVTDAARQLLMSLALDQTRDQLSVYSRPAKSTAFVGRMLRQVDEFKNAGVSPDRLQSVCEQLEGDSALAGKTREMALIYTYYQALLQNRFQDEKDSLLNCCRLLEGQGYFRGCTVFIDSFMTFMAGEKQLIRIILSECEELYITFPTDRLGEGQRQSPSDGELPVEDGTFDTARDTLRELLPRCKADAGSGPHAHFAGGESSLSKRAAALCRTLDAVAGPAALSAALLSRPFGKGAAAGAAGACSQSLRGGALMLRHRLYIWCGSTSCVIGRLR